MLQLFLLLGILSFIKYLGLMWMVEGVFMFALGLAVLALAIYLTGVVIKKTLDLFDTKYGKLTIQTIKVSLNGGFMLVAFAAYFTAGTIFLAFLLSVASLVITGKNENITAILASSAIIAIVCSAMYFKKRLSEDVKNQPTESASLN